jgi:DNA-binding transcriptional ArsR family regulator
MKKKRCACAVKSHAEISKMLKNIAENNRLKIICLLTKKEKCVCELMDELGLPQNLISYHLKVLIRSKIISFLWAAYVLIMPYSSP